MNLVLVDTSVWIDFFSGNLTAEEKTGLVYLLESEQVVIVKLHDIVKYEILVGAFDESEYERLKHILGPLRECWIPREQVLEFNRFGFELREKGLLGKFTDVSIAFIAKINKIPVFSRDEYFNKLAQKKVISVFSI